jgi:hypothetical protein
MTQKGADRTQKYPIGKIKNSWKKKLTKIDTTEFETLINRAITENIKFDLRMS